MPAGSLFLTIRTHQETIFQAEVAAVTSINGSGRFDILPEHAHFIPVIEKEVIITERSQKKKRIGIDIGVMHVEENTVNIYLEGTTQE